MYLHCASSQSHDLPQIPFEYSLVHLSFRQSSLDFYCNVCSQLNNNLNLISFHVCNFQGAERKTRDEERRAAKRKMTATGRKKLDELYHPVADRSEFYTMSDQAKPPVLFSPADDVEKVSASHPDSHHNNHANAN